MPGFAAEAFRDNFTGVESATVSGPLSKKKGDRWVS